MTLETQNPPKRSTTSVFISAREGTPPSFTTLGGTSPLDIEVLVSQQSIVHSPHGM